MRLTSLGKLALIGIALIGATAAQAATTAQPTTAAKAEATEADWTTTLNVKLALLRKLGTDTLHLDVNSLGGTVRLAGTVDKRETKELAGTVAFSVRGVYRVENAIRLEAAVANPSQAGAAVGEADAEVKDAVLETRLRLALIEKMGSDGFKIGTDAANGVVTLSFDQAFDSDSRERAVAIANGMRGVSKVVSVDKTSVDKTRLPHGDVRIDPLGRPGGRLAGTNARPGRSTLPPLQKSIVRSSTNGVHARTLEARSISRRSSPSVRGAMAADEVGEALEAELLLGGVGGFGDAVGVDQQQVAGPSSVERGW